MQQEQQYILANLKKNFLVLILNLVYNIVDYTMKKEKGKNTLDFTANFTTLKGCSSLLNIKYTIALNEGLPLKDGSELSNIQFLQNEKIINEEIDKFSAGEIKWVKISILYT